MVETMLWLLLASIIPVWVVEAEEWLSTNFAGRGYTGTYRDVAYLALLEGTFGKESEKWLQISQEVTLHDAVFFLPGRKLPNDLKGWLWKNGHLLSSKPEVIHAVVGLWGDLSPEARKQIADASQLSAIHIGLLVRYGSQVAGLRGKKLASALENLTPSEAYPTMGAFGRMLERAYGPNCPEAEEWFARWEASLSIPESPAFRVDQVWKEGAYTMRFVSRNNPERLFAGVLTNCCQHPRKEGAAAAWYAQEAPNGGLLALYKERQMVAQSFVWHPVAKPTVMCLDNIEALSEELGDKFFHMIEEFIAKRFLKVVVGAANNDFTFEPPKEGNPIPIPRDLTYSDAFEQQRVGGVGGVNFTYSLPERTARKPARVEDGRLLQPVIWKAKKILPYEGVFSYPSNYQDYRVVFLGSKETVEVSFDSVEVIWTDIGSKFAVATSVSARETYQALWEEYDKYPLHPEVENIPVVEWVNYFCWKQEVELPRELRMSPDGRDFLIFGWGHLHLKVRLTEEGYSRPVWFIQ